MKREYEYAILQKIIRKRKKMSDFEKTAFNFVFLNLYTLPALFWFSVLKRQL